MLRTSITPSILLFLLGCFTLQSVQAQGKKADSDVLDILCQAYEKNKRVREVTYTLYQNGKKKATLVAKKGFFDFPIQRGDGTFRLVVEKQGYLTKELLFNASDYPFESSFEMQEIFIEFIPQKDPMSGVYHSGVMGFDAKSRSFKITEVDTVSEVLQMRVEKVEGSLDRIYEKAVHNGDGLAKIEEYHFAKGYFEIALEAKPEDSYARQRITEMDEAEVAAREKPESVPTDEAATASTSQDASLPAEPAAKTVTSDPAPQLPKNQYYSVQLGAFHDWLDEQAFVNVPELKIVQGSDYKRCLSGVFADRNEAKARMREMREMGFEDAFVVTMQGQERIGF